MLETSAKMFSSDASEVWSEFLNESEASLKRVSSESETNLKQMWNKFERNWKPLSKFIK